MGSAKQLTDAQKGAIVELKRTGLSHKKISTQLKVSKSAVSKILKRYNLEGNFSVRSRCGRPSKVSKHTKRRIKRAITTDPFLTSSDLIREVSPLRCVSTETVSRVLRKEFRLWARKVQRKPMMTKTHLQKRKEFCQQTKDWTAEDWSQVMWSDESNFYLFDQSVWRVRRTRGSDPSDHRFTQPTVKHPPHVMIWGCFSTAGRGGLAILPQNVTMNSARYLEVLESHLLPFMAIRNTTVFMQDGAPCHQSKKVKEWLENHGIQTLKWPPNSPDLNPIENLWCVMKRRINKLKITSIAQLKQAIVETWTQQTDSSLCNKLAASMPSRINAVIKNKYYPSKY